MKEVLCFIYDGFADFETVLTCTGLSRTEDHELVYIAYDKTPVISSAGLKIIPDKAISEISQTKDIDGLIIPGGSERIIKPELENLIKQLNNEKKLLAAICAGPEFFARIGILKGRKYTTSQEPKDYKEKNELDPFPRDTYVDTRIVQDGNIITAQGYAFVDFALKIWDWFNVYEYDGEREELKAQFTKI